MNDAAPRIYLIVVFDRVLDHSGESPRLFTRSDRFAKGLRRLERS